MPSRSPRPESPSPSLSLNLQDDRRRRSEMASPGSSDSGVSPVRIPQGEEAAAELQDEMGYLPAPPKEFRRFTARNLELARLVSDRWSASDAPEDWLSTQTAILKQIGADERPDFDLRELVEPPSVDWILERGGWDVYGETYPITEITASLEEFGQAQLYPSTLDRRESLKRLLNTVLVTFIQLLDALVKPAPGGERGPGPDPERPREPFEADVLIEHIRLACVNMHHLCNELRPIQARETLQTMMRTQIDRRKARTEQLKRTCTEAKAVVMALKARYNSAAMDIDTSVSEANGVNASKDPSHGAADADWLRVEAAVEALR